MLRGVVVKASSSPHSSPPSPEKCYSSMTISFAALGKIFPHRNVLHATAEEQRGAGGEAQHYNYCNYTSLDV